MAAGENIEQLQREQANSAVDPHGRAANSRPTIAAPPARSRREGTAPRPPFAYQLPATAPVTEGLGRGRRQRRPLARPDARHHSRHAGHRAGGGHRQLLRARSATMTAC